MEIKNSFAVLNTTESTAPDYFELGFYGMSNRRFANMNWTLSAYNHAEAKKWFDLLGESHAAPGGWRELRMPGSSVINCLPDFCILRLSIDENEASELSIPIDSALQLNSVDSALMLQKFGPFRIKSEFVRANSWLLYTYEVSCSAEESCKIRLQAREQ